MEIQGLVYCLAFGVGARRAVPLHKPACPESYVVRGPARVGRQLNGDWLIRDWGLTIQLTN